MINCNLVKKHSLIKLNQCLSKKKIKMTLKTLLKAIRQTWTEEGVKGRDFMFLSF